MFGITEDPPFHVFGLDNKHPETGDDHMIDLGCALLERQRDIVQQMIFPLVEKEPDAEGDQPLSDHALEPGGFDYGHQQQQWDHIPELSQQGGNKGGEIHFISP